MKLIAGIVAMVLGVVGFAACIAGMVVVFSYKDEVSEKSVELLKAVDNSLEYASRQLDEAEVALGRTRKALDAFDGVVQRVRKEIGVKRGSVKQVSQASRRVTTSMDQARVSVDGADHQVEALDQTMSVVESFPFASLGKPLTQSLKRAVKSLLAASPLVQELEQLLEEIEFDEDVGEGKLDKVENLVKRIDGRLAEAESSAEKFREHLQQLKSNTKEAQEVAPGWIQLGAVVLMVLLGWVGLGQFCLAGWGWRWLRPSGSQ